MIFNTFNDIRYYADIVGVSTHTDEAGVVDVAGVNSSKGVYVQWVSVGWNPLLLNLKNIYDTLKPIIPVESLGSKYLNNYSFGLPLEE